MPKQASIPQAQGKYYLVQIPKPQGAAREIYFSPNGREEVPPEYAALHIEIERTLATLNALFADGGGFLTRMTSMRNDRKLDEYFGKLSGIALAAFGEDQVQLGRMALAGLQDEVVTREAGAVKNSYLRRLGYAAILLALVACMIYLYPFAAKPPLLAEAQKFMPLILGALLGTWLSFSLRRPVLAFADLAHLEEDRLDPSIRLLFVVGLTVIIGLLLSTEAIDITIGKLKTASSLTNGSVAFLVGCLCGIGEKGLSSAVSRRASDFVASLGGAVALQPRKDGEAAKETSAKSGAAKGKRARRKRKASRGK